ncbi:MAG: prepilin peptidase [Candidatus Nealsonbacteria bacterium CG23_combo_of_CG06-09_8_20_14_all_37_18]|uniref:Prepilin peptidase n=1 Tax=Candidatus Nealsonbacteria bacterium CG23_combo_of_CG06-09_8_20_14_all_37_18 TaxID=1974720 RepID=A0A2G9YZ52_9BACT|nr:MAG: prepilin peptidase [Candidatus Nealsonbacteria bacterium CG23_combo_of_CG06-09_8_20_14_all_37_18]
MFSLIIFLFGLIIGSFLNCVIYRLALPNFSLKNLGGLKGRSFCPLCKHELAWQDLIPVFSFIFLRGKCRYCREKISLQYPLVELAAGIIFLLVFLPWCNEFTPVNLLSLWYFWIISCFLIVIFVYDLKHYIIPDKIIYPAIIIAGIFNLQFLISEEGSAPFFTFAPINGSSVFNYSILAAILVAAFFLAIVLISRGKWMGIGDIKLAFLMGLFLGWPNILVALFSAFFIGAIIGVGLVLSGKKTLKSEVPFGPFLVTGTFIALFWGQEIIDRYLNLFLL